MSILLCILVICAVELDPSLLTDEFMYGWALFAIADALWARVIFGRK